MATTAHYITVDVITHEKTGLLIATSEEMKGLYVHGRNPDELNERIPQAIRAILEAEGKQVANVVPADEDRQPTGFRQARKRFELSEAA